MATITITKRERESGRRYVVRYRRGGRGYALEHAGSFKTEKEARERRDLIRVWISQGKNPADELRALLASPTPKLTVNEWAAKYLDSRLDVDSNTLRNYKVALKKAGETFGDRDPATISADDVAGWVADLAEKYKPGTISLYLLSFRMLLDYVGLDPNPVRDSRVRKPKHVRDEPEPPTAEHLKKILAAIPASRRLFFVVLEQGALRVGEAVSLEWGDIDVDGLRLRLRRSATKTSKSRWVYLPSWLMEAIEDTCPLEDRFAERRVFPGISEAVAYQQMRRACVVAKVPHYSPHSLRHRRLSVWHQAGVPARELAERAGHARPSMSLDVYSHVLTDGEVPDAWFAEVIGATEAA